MSQSTQKRSLSLALAVGTTVAAAGLFSAASQADNPFSSNELSSGYMMLAEKTGEGACGEGKCGGKKNKEGSCGEGSCGGMYKNMDADGDGKITKEEFLKAHETKFAEMDKNGDGTLSDDEMKARKGGNSCGSKKKEGACGEGKCGGNQSS